MELETKKKWLIVAGIACLLLAYYGSKDIPYTDWLSFGAGGLHALNFAINLAK